MRNIPPLLKTFLSMAKTSIDDKGIYPHILIFQDQDGKNSIASMAINNPDEYYEAVKKIMDKEKPIQLIMGMDRTNLDGQSIDMKYHSVLTFAYYAMGKWSVGAMPYASADDIGEVQMNNDWWIKAINRELKSFNFLEPEITDEVIGTAYQEKISVTTVRETSMGRKYEGFINQDKLSDKVKTFLRDKSLDINNRDSVISVIKALGETFDFVPEDFGFWTLKAGHGIFPARSSKTKVYLEGVESIIEKIN
jgi:hypothetical protein